MIDRRRPEDRAGDRAGDRAEGAGWRWTRDAPGPWEGDVEGLARALGRACRGEVGFGPERAMYAHDGSNYRQVPLGFVRPADRDDVLAALAVCREFGAPVLPRGDGTSLAGQTVNVAVVLDCSRHMTGLLELDPGRRLARVQPGLVLDDLRDAAERHHLTFGPDPATHAHCTLGGMIGNNACGIHALQTGRTADNVEALEVVTYDGLVMRVGATAEDEVERFVRRGGREGHIYRRLRAIRDAHGDAVRARYPRIPRRVSGYNLDELLPEKGFNVARALVGTEGTCAFVLEATVRLAPSPRARALLVVGYEDVYQAADDVPDVLAHGPWALEGLDRRLVRANQAKRLNPDGIALLPPGDGWLLVEVGDDTPRAAGLRARALEGRLRGRRHVRGSVVLDDPHDQELVWEVRESGLGATARIGDQDFWEGWEDSAVPPERMGDYMRDLRAVLDRHGLDGAFYGHFGQGCLHTRIDFGLRTPDGVRRFRAFLDEAADLCIGYGGSLSGEHGDGQSRAELLPRMFGEELCRAFQQFKATWDPDDRCNPGKVVHPYGLLTNLALGPDHRPWEPDTAFTYPEDEGRFSRAVMRCVGVGKCRKTDQGVMCPSYMVTREEKHATRGRARLLLEMLEGDPVRGGWESEAVREALDLCLSCKACKKECPVGVDMATYRAEFMAHHYQRRPRPRAAYSMGQVWRWCRLAAQAPGLANAMAAAPGLSRALKAAAGIAQERDLPRFAPRTFRDWFRARRGPPPSGPRVILWPDTFTNYFHPDIGRSAVEVLEAAGFSVVIPRQELCCGRPLYEFGFLDQARRQLRDILDALSREIAEGVPVVGLEPSCVSTFRDELPDLLSHDEHSRRLARQTFTLAELLERRGWRPPPLPGGRAVVQPHCHHASIMGFDPDRALLGRLGLAVDVLDAGCCGMAGAFGFEAEKYDVSIACAERALLPAVRAAPPGALVLADGFSCRTQIQQGCGRPAMHLAEALHLALAEEARRAHADRRLGRSLHVTAPPGRAPEEGR